MTLFPPVMIDGIEVLTEYQATERYGMGCQWEHKPEICVYAGSWPSGYEGCVYTLEDGLERARERQCTTLVMLPDSR